MKLMTERQKYENWLRDLDAKRDSTSPKAYERVRSDYSARLTEVMDALRQHTSAMQEHARNLMVRLKEVEISEEELREKQAEEELRAQVGELTGAEYELSKKKAERLIAKFKEDQELIASDLNRIRELLSSGSPDSKAPAQEPPKRHSQFDELEFLKSVVGSPTPSSISPAVSKRAEESPAEKTKVSSVEAKAPASETKAAAPPAVESTPPAGEKPPPAQPAAKAAASEAATPASVPATPADGTKPSTVATAASAGMPTPDAGMPSVLASVAATDERKTLKCTECGAMNLPTEWYCERCGAELTLV